ncbi:hypothetical protein [Qingrenia yutianensis]|uniref:Uncharacterized protein n=1 Tax=Qingrenia yutianensis TaxID=2763676 RepID=A0A926FBI4_9FIRM|nr:hypothetical protein [Qingrenia yutianensis]MBC8597455.1 hypothetical protein [Qingrenia yutianensis]
MTDEQIIKAFEEILKNQNNKLSLIERAVCDDVLSLANRQKAEIEELKEKHAEDERVLNDRVQESVNAVSKADQKYICALERSITAKDVEIERLLQKLQQAKSEAIKEFAEQLKKRFYLSAGRCVVDVYHIDNLVKKMTEENK